MLNPNSKAPTTSNGLCLGQRVEMTEFALRLKLDGRKRARTGIVYAVYNPNSSCVDVLRDGYKRPSCWHVSMWQAEKGNNHE